MRKAGIEKETTVLHIDRIEKLNPHVQGVMDIDSPLYCAQTDRIFKAVVARHFPTCRAEPVSLTAAKVATVLRRLEHKQSLQDLQLLSTVQMSQELVQRLNSSSSSPRLNSSSSTGGAASSSTGGATSPTSGAAPAKVLKTLKKTGKSPAIQKLAADVMKTWKQQIVTGGAPAIHTCMSWRGLFHELVVEREGRLRKVSKRCRDAYKDCQSSRKKIITGRMVAVDAPSSPRKGAKLRDYFSAPISSRRGQAGGKSFSQMKRSGRSGRSGGRQKPQWTKHTSAGAAKVEARRQPFGGGGSGTFGSAAGARGGVKGGAGAKSGARGAAARAGAAAFLPGDSAVRPGRR
jgi:hypothetical protein